MKLAIAISLLVVTPAASAATITNTTPVNVGVDTACTFAAPALISAGVGGTGQGSYPRVQGNFQVFCPKDTPFQIATEIAHHGVYGEIALTGVNHGGVAKAIVWKGTTTSPREVIGGTSMDYYSVTATGFMQQVPFTVEFNRNYNGTVKVPANDQYHGTVHWRLYY